MEKSSDFEELFGLLNHHKVRYLIVGGYAYSIHAEPRYTKDLDIFFERSLPNAKKIMQVLRDFGFKSLDISTVDLTQPNRVIQLGYPPLRVDFINQIDGIEFNSCWDNKFITTYGDQPVNVIGRNDLIKNKLASGREQDLLDAKVLKKFD